jgi:hypothetical protein
MKAPEPYLVWRDPDPSSVAEAPEALGKRDVRKWLRNAALLALLLVLVPPTPFLMSPLWLLAVATGYGAAILIGLVMLLPLRRLILWPDARISVERHKRLAEIALVLSALHTVLFLAGETLTLEYLWPSQPRFMVAGNVGLVVLASLVVTSLERIRARLFGPRVRFRPIHVSAALALVVLVAAHMAGSGIFIAHPMKTALLAIVSGALLAATLRRSKERQEPEAALRDRGAEAT